MEEIKPWVDTKRRRQLRDLKRVQELYDQGKSQADIADIFNCSQAAVSRALKAIRLGKCTTCGAPPYRREEYRVSRERLLKMRDAGLTLEQIASVTGLSAATASRRLDTEQRDACRDCGAETSDRTAWAPRRSPVADALNKARRDYARLGISEGTAGALIADGLRAKLPR